MTSNALRTFAWLSLMLGVGCPEPPTLSDAGPNQLDAPVTTDSGADVTNDVPGDAVADATSDGTGEVWTPGCVLDSDCVPSRALAACERMACGAGGVCSVASRLGRIAMGGPLQDRWTAVAAVGSDVVLAGATASKGAGGWDAWVAWTSADGVVRWQRTFGGSGHELAQAVVAFDQGAVVGGVAGSEGSVMALDPEGEQLWHWQGGSAVSALSAEGAQVRAAGWDGDEPVVWVLDAANGDLLDEWRPGGIGRIHAVHSLAADVVVAGWRETVDGRRAWAARLNGPGAPVWEQSFDGTRDATALLLDGDAIVLAGAGDAAPFVMKLNSDATVTSWQRAPFLGPVGGDQRVLGLAATGDYGYAVVGTAGGQGFAAQFSTEGALVWSRPGDTAYGGIVVVGDPAKLLAVGEGAGDAVQVATNAFGGMDCDPSDECYTLTPADCPASDSCTQVSCDPATGCATAALVCDDGVDCTDDSCDPGAGCTFVGNPSVCDDGETCTADVCDPVLGCVFEVQSGACDDGSECTQDDACVDGACVGTAALCDDGEVCTEDSCDDASGGCVFSPTTGGACDDGNACLGDDACDDGVCMGTDPLVCDDGLPCTDDSCAPASGCTTTPNDGGACDDGDACTGTDACVAGGCVGSDPLVCDDGVECTTDSCDAASGCVFSPKTGDSCDDGKQCTENDVCAAGVCAGTTAGGACDDNDACTDDGCDATGVDCTHDQVTCDDGELCTTDTCDAGTGCVFSNLGDGSVCDDGDICTPTSACQSGGCVATSTCDDGDACTVDSCDAQGCQHADLDCDDGNACTVNSCDTAAGCQVANEANGTGCDDGDVCTPTSECQGGGCVVTSTCDDGDACTVDSCDAQGCQHADLDCDDGDTCTVDSCDTAVGCQVATAADGTGCDDGDACTTTSQCQSGVCTGLDGCDDTNLCTTDACVGGVCEFTAITCPSVGDPCATGSCDPALGCTSTPADDGTSCDDGNLCTTGETCLAGFCTPSAEWTAMTTHSPPVPLDGYFGTGIVVDGEWMAAAEPYAGVLETGRIHVYRKVAGSWLYVAGLTPQGIQQWAGLGDYGALSIDDLGGGAVGVAAGAPWYSDWDAGYGIGAAYYFERDAATGQWSEEAIDFVQSPGKHTQFGEDIALSEGWLAVSDPSGGDGPSSYGHVYLFERVAGAWEARGWLESDRYDDSAYYGGAMAIEDGLLVVGAAGESDAGAFGAAYVYSYDGANWGLDARLSVDTAGVDENFAAAVATDGSRIVVGALHGDHSGINAAGAVYVFEDLGTGWALQDKLTASDAQDLDQLGGQVDVDGDTIVAGAYRADGPLGSQDGAVYAFRHVNGAWVVRGKWHPDVQDAQLSWCGVSGVDIVMGAANANPGGVAYSVQMIGTCDDGDACTIDRCELATGCDATAQLVCVDGDPCTNDTCDTTTGCDFAAVAEGGGCDDGNPCTTALCTAGACIAAGAWVSGGKLLPPAPAEDGVFGFRVAVDGAWMAVGESEGGGAVTTGVVHVYTWRDGAWQYHAELAASQGYDADFFGSALDVSAPGTSPPRIAVGAYGTGQPAPNQAGRVHVFELDPATDRWVGTMVANPSPALADEFGKAVTLDGKWLVVGAPGASEDETGGVAYVYHRLDGAWQVHSYLEATDAAFDAEFGEALSVREDLLVVGAPGGESVYVFERLGDVWLQTFKLTDSAAVVQWFGIDVATDGQTVVVGAPLFDGAFPGQGAAYVYEWSDGKWLGQQLLGGVDVSQGDQFGIDVDVDGAHLVVGAFGFASAVNDNEGAVFLFQRSGGLWFERDRWLSGVPFASLGSVAIDGAHVLGGAPWEMDGGGELAGAVYLFDLVGDCADGDDCTVDMCDVGAGVCANPNLVCDDGNACTADSCTAGAGCSSTPVASGTACDDGNICDTAAVCDGAGGCLPPLPGLTHAAKLGPEPPIQAGSFAYKTRIDGDWLAIAEFAGSPERKGQVYVYRRVAGAWELHSLLTASDGAINDRFGVVLALRDLGAGSVAVAVGADATDDPALSTGRAYYFEFDAVTGAWSEEIVANPDDDTGDSFGYAVAMSAGWLAVGAPAAGESGTNGGVVYLYERVAGLWESRGFLESETPETGGFYGATIAIEGNWLAVAATKENVSFGAVYLYARQGGSWVIEDVINGDGSGADQEQFGTALTMDGGRLAVGAWYYDAVAADDDRGAAYIFERDSGGTWTKTVRFDGGYDLEYFGACVALHDDTMLVGSYGTAAGALTRYDHDGQSWVKRDTWDVPVAGGFVWDCALDGTRAVVGAADEPVGAVWLVGAAYVFELVEGCDDGDPCTVDRCDLAVGCSSAAMDCDDGNDCTADSCSAGACVNAALGDGASCDDGNPCTTNDACLTGSCASANLWESEGTLLAPAPAEPGEFGRGVAIDGDWMAVSEPKGGPLLAGSVHVYQRLNGTWTWFDDLSPMGAVAGDDFGYAVAVRDLGAGNVGVAVGAPLATRSGFTSTGRAYLFEYDAATGVWSEEPFVNPTDKASDVFGWSVALHGDWVAVGAPSADQPAQNLGGLVYVFKRSGAVWTAEGSVVQDVPGPNHQFGVSLAMQGDLLVVGAHRSDSSNGTVHVFQRTGDAWPQVAALGGPGDQYGQYFGCSVAIDGSRIIGGAYQQSNWQGAAYIFEGDPVTGWLLEDTLVPSDGAPDWFFGDRVDISGNTACVAATGADGDAGAVYRFERVAGRWIERGKWQPATVGTSYTGPCAVDGVYAVVGSPHHEDGAASKIGMATVYELVGACDDGDPCTIDVCDPAVGCQMPPMDCGDGDVCTDDTCSAGVCSHAVGTQWSPLVEWAPPGTASDGEFGASVAVAGPWMAIGRPEDGSGRVHLYRKDVGGWTYHSPVTPTGVTASAAFGASVALADLGPDGYTLAVGAPSDATLMFNGGSVHPFTYAPGTDTWDPGQPLVDDTPVGNGRFGTDVALDASGGGRLLIGRPSAFSGGLGRAYLYTLSGGSWSAPETLEPSDASANDRFGFSVAMDGDTIVVGAYRKSTLSNRSGTVYVYEFVTGAWSQTAALTNGPKSTLDQVGYVVAIDGGVIAAGAPNPDDTGKVSIFEKNPTAWEKTATIVPEDAVLGDAFGKGVAVLGNELVASASSHDLPVANAGAAYRFERIGGVWVQRQKFSPTTTTSGAIIGHNNGIAISSDVLVLGASGEDGATVDDEGAVYLFERCSP